MSKQKVSTVDGREVKLFATRKEAREFNRKEGTKGVNDLWHSMIIIQISKKKIGSTAGLFFLIPNLGEASKSCYRS